MSSDVRDFLRKTRDSDIEKYNRILEQMQDIQDVIEEDLDQEDEILSRETRLKTTSVTIGDPHVSADNPHDHQTTVIIRKKPRPANSYPLVHTITGSISFKVAGHYLGGNGIFDGSSYITVGDKARLNVTDEITIALWIKPAAASADKIVVRKNNQYELKLANPNKIQFRVYSGGAWKTPVEYTYTPDAWIHVIATYKSAASGQKLYINNVLQDSDSEIGAINTTANSLDIAGDGTLNLPNNTAISWLTILHKEVDSAWRTNIYTNNLLDTSDGNTEMTTIPFQGDADPRPDATTGLFKTS